MMVAEEQFYVIKLLEYNINDDGSCVCVPKSWIKLHRSENQVLVLYPKEDLETTLKRIEDGEKYHTSWLLYRGIVIHVTDNFEEAKLWIAKLNNGNERASPATLQYTDQSTSTTETRRPQQSSFVMNNQNNAVSLKDEESIATNKARKRILQPNDADEIEHRNKHKQIKIDTSNKTATAITNCTNQVKGDCLRRELLSNHHSSIYHNLNQRAHKQLETLTTDNEINSPVSQTVSINLASSTDILTNESGQSSSSPKHVPIKVNDKVFQNNFKSSYINRFGGNSNYYSHDVNKQSSLSPQGPIKTTVSTVPEEKLHKNYGDLHTNVGRPYADTANKTNSTQDLEYLIDKYYEIYDPTNTDQFLKASVCKLLEEIHGSGILGKNIDANCTNSNPLNVITNPQSTNSPAHSNDSKVVTSTTELKTLQNKLTNKPFHKEVTPEAINKLSYKLSEAGYYVPECGNKIADSNNGKMKDNYQTTPHKNQALPNISSKLRQESEHLIEQTNPSQEIPEYEIIVEKSTQTNKITILDTSKKENSNKITTSPDSTFKSEQYFPNSTDTSVNHLLTKTSKQIQTEQNSSLKSSNHLNRNIQKLQNMSKQLVTQPLCEQYPRMSQHYWTPPRHHQNNLNNNMTTDRAHNTHYQSFQNHQTGSYENVSSQTINNSLPTTSYKNRPLTQSIKNISQHFPFPADHSRCCNRLYEEQHMQANKNCPQYFPGAHKTHCVARSYPTTMRNLSDQNLPIDFRPDLAMQMYPNKLYQSFNYSNARNSVPRVPPYAYPEQQESLLNSPIRQYERSLAKNHVNQTIRPETVIENTEVLLYSPCPNLRDRQLRTSMTHDNTVEKTVTKDRCNMDKQINSIHADQSTDQRAAMSQETTSQPIEGSKESLHSLFSRESIQEPCSQCGHTGNQGKSNQNLSDSIPLPSTMASLMNDAFEKINLNVIKLNSELSNTNNMIEKFIESFRKVMDTIIEYNQKINESTTSTSQTLTKTKQGNKYENNDNKTVHHNISNEEHTNENQDVLNKAVTKRRSFVLPPDYDPTDSRWTLKFQSLGRGIMELVPGTRVYINIMDLGRCLRKAKTCKKLARMLLREIFSQSALRVCSLAEVKAKSSNSSDRDKRPGLDANARHVLVTYVQDYGRRRGWYVPDKNSILKSIGGLLQRLRI